MTETHKGIVIRDSTKVGYADVWIPTKGAHVPLGHALYTNKSTGSSLQGNDLDKSRGSSIECKIAAPLTHGAWFRADSSKGTSIFDDYSDDAYDYRLNPNYQTHGTLGNHSSYIFPETDNAPCIDNFTLSVSGGNPIPQFGTLPKGMFTLLAEGQNVIVQFIEGSSMPIITHVLPTDEERIVMHKQASI